MRGKCASIQLSLVMKRSSLVAMENASPASGHVMGMMIAGITAMRVWIIAASTPAPPPNTDAEMDDAYSKPGNATMRMTVVMGLMSSSAIIRSALMGSSLAPITGVFQRLKCAMG
jgi:hypothetical protein